MAACPECWREKPLLSPRCPHCNQETHIGDTTGTTLFLWWWTKAIPTILVILFLLAIFG